MPLFSRITRSSAPEGGGARVRAGTLLPAHHFVRMEEWRVFPSARGGINHCYYRGAGGGGLDFSGTCIRERLFPFSFLVIVRDLGNGRMEPL